MKTTWKQRLPTSPLKWRSRSSFWGRRQADWSPAHPPADWVRCWDATGDGLHKWRGKLFPPHGWPFRRGASLHPAGFFPEDFLIMIDESHMTMGQIKGMYNGDRSQGNAGQLRISACHQLWTIVPCAGKNLKAMSTKLSMFLPPWRLWAEQTDTIIEQIIRPTGTLGPRGRSTTNHGPNGWPLAKSRSTWTRASGSLSPHWPRKWRRIWLITWKKWVSGQIHALGYQDLGADRDYPWPAPGCLWCLVGINLLREGIDVPEVSLVAILDADKEGFLRNEEDWSRPLDGRPATRKAMLSCMRDKITDSMPSHGWNRPPSGNSDGL